MAPECDDSVLLISAPRSGAGGLFQLDGNVTAIDRIGTQGLAVRDGRLARIMSSGRAASPCGDVLVYDDDGLRRSYRMDGFGNMHDALYVDDALLIVNTAGNAIEALREDGTVATWWQGPPRFDAWHINCLFSEGSSVVATAFGNGTRSSAWRDENGTDGVIIRLPEETVVLRGLDKPHDPRRIDGLWVVCQSGKSQLLGFDDDGRLQKSCTFEGFTRGLAYDADHLFVGESRMRQNAETERWSRINVIERDTWALVDVFEVPVPEIYALVRAPRSLAAGVRKGLAFASGRVRSEGPLAPLTAPLPSHGWRITDMLPQASRRFTIDPGDIPRTLAANTHLKLTCHVTNHSDVSVGSFGPYPVDISYRWEAADGLPVRQTIRFDLSNELAPGASYDVEIIVAAPDRCGEFHLTLFLSQGDVSWSNALAAEPARGYDVTVVAGTALPIRDVLARSAARNGRAAAAAAGEEITLHATTRGIFSSADGQFTLVDPRPTVAVRSDGMRLYRSIEGAAPGTLDLIVYDRYGAAGIQRGAGTAARREPSLDETIAVVPAALVEGLMTGFRTNPTRVREEAHLARFRELEREPVTVWASAGTLWPAAMAVRLRAVVPQRMTAGGETLIPYDLENRGNGFLVPGIPHPVALSYRWYDAQGKQAGRDATSWRTPLPRTLAPGDTLSGTVRVVAPKRSGRFTLLITCVQELVAWFSDVSEANGFVSDVDVAAES